jgi:hypothetical protein
LNEKGLPKDLQDFLLQHISSVVQLELLLLVHGSAPRTWTREQIARELRIDPSWAETQARDLCNRGLLECMENPDPTQYRFEPAAEVLREAVQRLADAYEDRRVSIISFIYSRPPDQLKQFADAFRIRKERTDE